MATVDQSVTDSFGLVESGMLNGENAHPVSDAFRFTELAESFVVGSFPWQFPFVAEILDTRTDAEILTYEGPNGALLQ
jgi:hypothetical protein